MGYLDFTTADLVRLTRERRRERLLAVYMAPMPDITVLRAAYQRLHGSPLPERPCPRYSALAERFQSRTFVHPDHGGNPVLRSIGRHERRLADQDRRSAASRYRKPEGRDHGTMAPRPFRALWNLQGGACYICRKPFVADDWATLDHVIPRAVGGGDAGNILLACGGCNNRKGDRGPKPCEMIYMAAVNAGFLAAFEALEAA